jgi:hypothetical protein
MKRTILSVAVTLLLSGIAANAAILDYYAILAPEVAGATGSGYASFQVDTVGQTLSIQADWSGLSGITTVAHIHCCTAVPNTGTIGVAVTPGTLPGFPVGVSAGSYGTTIDLTDASSFTVAFVNNFGGGTLPGAVAALLAGFEADTAYLNIHSNEFPGGEIRGFIQPVPEPSAFALSALGMGSLFAFAARRRQR